MRRIAYVAGKVSGLPERDVKDKFFRVSRELTAMGYQVVMPASVSDHSRDWEDTMRVDIKKLMECDEVHMLPCWQSSRGAQLERDIALRLGMQVIYH